MFGLLAGGVFCLASCSDDEFSEVQSALTVTSAETSIEAAGGTKQINVDGPVASVYSAASWLTVSHEGSVVSVSADCNPDVQSRNTIVVLKASENDSTIVNVSQFGMRYSAELPERLTLLGHMDSELKYDVYCDIPMNITSDIDGVTSTYSDGSLTLSFPKLDGTDKKEGYVEIQAGIITHRIEVSQYYADGNYDLTGTSIAGAPVVLHGTVSGGETGTDVSFSLTDYPGVTVPFTFVPETGSLKVASGRYCGQNGRYYIYTCFLDMDANQQSSASDLITMEGVWNLDDATADCTLMNNGSWLFQGEPLNPTVLRLGRSNTQSFNIRSVLVDVENPVLTKVVAAPGA